MKLQILTKDTLDSQTQRCLTIRLPVPVYLLTINTKQKFCECCQWSFTIKLSHLMLIMNTNEVQANERTRPKFRNEKV